MPIFMKYDGIDGDVTSNEPRDPGGTNGAYSFYFDGSGGNDIGDIYGGSGTETAEPRAEFLTTALWGVSDSIWL